MTDPSEELNRTTRREFLAISTELSPASTFFGADARMHCPIRSHPTQELREWAQSQRATAYRSTSLSFNRNLFEFCQS